MHKVGDLTPQGIGRSKIVLFDLVIKHDDLGEEKVFIKKLP